ncbi:MAG TPA: outer membrane beta-barrel protein [Kofleriaceae bacterium]|nr:outer membrane beta-barrel protein [Kofleriaceae bacterium]
MNRRLPLLVGAFGLLALVGSETAEAGRRGWFGGGGGGVRMSGRGSVSVHWSSPRRAPSWGSRWSVGGSIYVGPRYPRYRYYRPYRPYYFYYSQPTYVPSYYGGAYYPVAPAPATAAPGVVAVAAPVEQAPLPKFGLGLFAGGVTVEDIEQSSDYGLLGRLRVGGGGLFVEGELGKTSYENDLRVDRRLGASLIYELGTRNRFAPYVLAGAGVQQAEVAGEYSTNQNFAELGVGLRFAVTPKLHLAVDVRAGSRDSMSGDSAQPAMGTISRTIAPPTGDAPDDNEGYSRARLSAVLFF